MSFLKTGICCGYSNGKVSEPNTLLDFRLISVASILCRITEKFSISGWLRSKMPREALEDQFIVPNPLAVVPVHLLPTSHHFVVGEQPNFYTRYFLVDSQRHLMLLTTVF